MGRLADNLNGFTLETSADPNVDKRRGKRVNKKAVICWNCINPNVNSDAYEAEMVNFSESGMYFETDFFSKSRGVICIKLKRGQSHEDAESAEWLRSIQVGEVKWWKEIDEGDHSRFGIGVQYYR